MNDITDQSWRLDQMTLTTQTAMRRDDSCVRCGLHFQANSPSLGIVLSPLLFFLFQLMMVKDHNGQSHRTECFLWSCAEITVSHGLCLQQLPPLIQHLLDKDMFRNFSVGCSLLLPSCHLSIFKTVVHSAPYPMVIFSSWTK